MTPARVSPRTARVLWRAGTVVTSLACVVVSALPDPSRPVLVAAGAAVVVSVVAALSGWRPAGDATVALVTVTVLMAAALDGSDLRRVQVVLAGPLVLMLISALDRGAAAGRDEVTVVRAPAAPRLAAPAAATGAAVLVTLTAAQQVAPSVRWVLVGLAASVAAMVVATRAHRN